MLEFGEPYPVFTLMIKLQKRPDQISLVSTLLKREDSLNNLTETILKGLKDEQTY